MWAVGDQVRVVRMLPSFHGKNGLTAGQLQNKTMTVKSLDKDGRVKEVGIYPVRYIGDLEPGIWSLFNCPDLKQKVLIEVKN